MNATFDLKESLKLLRLLKTGRGPGTQWLRVTAIKEFLIFEAGQGVVWVPALVLEPGAFTTRRTPFNKVLASFTGSKTLTLQADAGRFRINSFSGQILDYDPSPKRPKGFEPIADEAKSDPPSANTTGLVPIGQVSKSAKAEAPQTPPRDITRWRQWSRPPRIVMIDDLPAVLDTLESLTKIWFKEVTILRFTDAEQAYQELEREAPDLFITDVCHPAPDGDELLRRLTEKKATFPIFIISAYVRKIEDLRPGSVGPDLKATLIPKPFTIDEFYRQLLNQVGMSTLGFQEGPRLESGDPDMDGVSHAFGSSLGLAARAVAAGEDLAIAIKMATAYLKLLQPSASDTAIADLEKTILRAQKSAPKPLPPKTEAPNPTDESGGLRVERKGLMRGRNLQSHPDLPRLQMRCPQQLQQATSRLECGMASLR